MSGNTGYLLAESFKGLFRNRQVNLAAVGVLVACLVISGSFVLAAFAVNGLLADIGDRSEISVYVEDYVLPEDSAAIKARLEETPNVAFVRYVSKEEGLEEIRKDFAALPDRLENDNPLRDVFHVRLDDLALLSETIDEVASITGIAKVNSREETAASIVRVRNAVAALGAAFAAVLGVISVVIVANAIRVSAFARKTEISVMKTVGATDRFIGLLFTIESVFMGILSAGIAYLAVWLLYGKLVYPQLTSVRFLNVMPFSEARWPLLAAFFAVGILMSAAGSSAAVRKYLKT